jgi:hypothetical protein
MLLETIYREPNIERYNTLCYRWDRLIHIDFSFHIDGKYEDNLDILFNEEILWERENQGISQMKEFCARFILENIKNNITLDFVECK